MEKVDQLINLVGELVITQAMLAQNSRGLDPVVYQQLVTGLTDLDRNTRDPQEAVMSIRMIPMSTVFSRFPACCARPTSWARELVTQGEATELDKGWWKDHRPADPPGAQLLRPRRRNAGRSHCQGKPETGTITLAASHQGGSIVIEVRRRPRPVA